VSDASIPLPRPTPLSRPYWDGCREGLLRFQRCRACGTAVFIPQPVCSGCFGDTLEWVDSTGRGSVYSYSVVHRAPSPGFTVPYIVVIAELSEGWHLLSNLLDCAPEDVFVGMPIEVVFEVKSDTIHLPCFRPAPRRAGAEDSR
jgi:uncharacterized OB-fold protein